MAEKQGDGEFGNVVNFKGSGGETASTNLPATAPTDAENRAPDAVCATCGEPMTLHGLNNPHPTGCPPMAISLPPIELDPRSKEADDLFVRDVREAITGPKRGTKYHLRIDLRGALDHWSDSSWLDCVTDDDGSQMTPPQVRAKFKSLVAAGTFFIPMGTCSNFDPVNGCQGHEVDLPESNRDDVRDAAAGER